MHIDILCLFPDYFRGPLDVSMLKRAKEKGLLTVDIVDIRQFSNERFRKVDDRPYGGGPGMVMMADPLVGAIRAKRRTDIQSRTIYMSPQGAPLTAEKCRELAQYEQLILVSGHYEGIDQRVLDSDIDEEISIGDYVLTNGSLAAIVLIDATSRFIPGVLGDEEGASTDSFEKGILDWPHYTRPEVYEGVKVPEVLLGGDHAKIEAWRKSEALKKTKCVRPELWLKAMLPEEGVAAVESAEKPALKELVLGCKDIKEAKAFYKRFFKRWIEQITEEEIVLALDGLRVRVREDVDEPALLLEANKEHYWALAQAAKNYIQESDISLLDPSRVGWRIKLKIDGE